MNIIYKDSMGGQGKEPEKPKVNSYTRYKVKKRKVFPHFLSFLCGILFLSQCLMVCGLFWMHKVKTHSYDLNQQMIEFRHLANANRNENFRKWLIDGGNFRYYTTMKEAMDAWREFGDEVKRKKDENAYRQEVLKLLKERAIKT